MTADNRVAAPASGPDTEPLVDPDHGVVRLTRAQLAAVADLDAGRRPDAAALDQASSAGAVVDHRPHPVLGPVLTTVASARSRGVLRRWRGQRLPVAEVLVGEGGVVVLPGGSRADDVHDIGWHPRPTAVARVVHDLLGLPANDGRPPFDDKRRPWSTVVDAALDPSTNTHLADLRWACPAADDPSSVMVLAWNDGGGMGQVVSAGSGSVRVEPVHPLDVWAGLTALH